MRRLPAGHGVAGTALVNGQALPPALQELLPAHLPQGALFHVHVVVDIPAVPVQEHHGAARPQGFHALLPQGESSAAGDDQALLTSQFLGYPLLPVPKPRLALLGKDCGDGAACGLFDALVGVHKLHAQFLGQELSHGRLAAAHHTN